MLRATLTTAAVVLALGVLSSCGDDDGPGPSAGAGRSGGGSAGTAAGRGGNAGSGGMTDLGGAGGDDSGVAGAGGDSSTLGPCLDRPDELPRPPAGRLPCELFPPGFSQ